jgi:hypothetical protein
MAIVATVPASASRGGGKTAAAIRADVVADMRALVKAKLKGASTWETTNFDFRSIQKNVQRAIDEMPEFAGLVPSFRTSADSPNPRTPAKADNDLPVKAFFTLAKPAAKPAATGDDKVTVL